MTLFTIDTSTDELQDKQTSRPESIVLYPEETLPVVEDSDPLIQGYQSLNATSISTTLPLDRHFVAPLNYSNDSFKVVNKWIGRIVEINDEGFVAEINDLYDEGELERAELYFDEVSERDMDMVKEGAIFYWSIGFKTTNGTRERSSLIRFRRLPEWKDRHQADYNPVLDKINHYNKNILWD